MPPRVTLGRPNLPAESTRASVHRGADALSTRAAGHDEVPRTQSNRSSGKRTMPPRILTVIGVLTIVALGACSTSSSGSDGGGGGHGGASASGSGGAGTGGSIGTGGSTDAGGFACTIDGGQCPVGYRCGCGGPGIGQCTCHKECTTVNDCSSPDTMCGCSASDPAPKICVNACFCLCG